MKSYLTSLHDDSFRLNTKNVIEAAQLVLGNYDKPRIADLGTGDGLISKELRGLIPDADITCVEVYPPHVAAARAAGFSVLESDLNGAFNLPESSFDLVVANQVIEHLYDTDNFLRECRLALKKNGGLVISTENCASWHNVGALVLGWQPFSLTNVSSVRGGIGNPLALLRGGAGAPFPMQHHRLFSLRGLTELLEAHGFKVQRKLGAGYHPLPPSIGTLNPRHAHFITIAAQKVID
jgi:SAM-dependent methyltransferase